jgi:hypothetical protein
MKRVSLTLAAVAILSFCEGLAHGGLLSPHGEASISGPALDYGFGFNQTVDGDTTFLQNSAASSFDGATVTGSAISHTVPNYSQFLGGQASSTQAQGVAYGSAVVAATYATGIWRDVLFLNGTGPLPSAVTFHFTVEGNMTGLSTPYLNSAIGISYQDYFVAQVYAPSTTDFVRGGGTPNTAVFGLNVNSDGSTTPDIRGWDSFTAGPSGGFT